MSVCVADEKRCITSAGIRRSELHINQTENLIVVLSAILFVIIKYGTDKAQSTKYLQKEM